MQSYNPHIGRNEFPTGWQKVIFSNGWYLLPYDQLHSEIAVMQVTKKHCPEKRMQIGNMRAELETMS